MKCEECGTDLGCIQHNDLCRECDEQYLYCYIKCKNPCRTKEEQKLLYSKWKSDWKEVSINYE